MDGLIFIGSCSGTFYALDRASGKTRWHYDVGADGKQTSFHGKPVVDGGTIVIGADHACDPQGIGHLYSFNIPDGTVRWKYASPVGLSTNAVRIGSNIWVGTVSGDWVRVDHRTGGRNGHIPSPAPELPCEIPKWLATSDDSIFAVGRDDFVYSLSSKTERVEWKTALPAAPSTSPVVLGDEVFVGARDHNVYRLTRGDGRIKSWLSVKGIPTGRPVVAGKTVFLIADSPDAERGALIALDRNGVRWTTDLERRQSSEQPYPWNGTMVVGDCAGQVTAIWLDSGSIAWTVPLEGCIRSIGGDKAGLFIGTEGGTVFALQR